MEDLHTQAKHWLQQFAGGSKQVLLPLAILLCLTSVGSWGMDSDSRIGNIERGTLDLSQLQTGQTLRLQGEWQFAADQLSTPDQENDSWLSAPGAWRQQGPQAIPQPYGYWLGHSKTLNPGHGIGSYQLSITPPLDSQGLGLYLDRVCSSAKVFLSSPGQSPQLLGELGRVATAGQSSPYAGSKLLPLNFKGSGPQQLLIQVANDDFRFGGLCGEIYIGDLQSLSQMHSRHILGLTMLCAMLVMGGIYSLSIYSQRREDRAPWYLMMACFSAAGMFFNISGLTEVLFDTEASWLFELRYSLCYLAFCWLCYSSLMFYHCHFQSKIPPRALQINLAITIGCSLFFIATPTADTQPWIWLFGGYWVLEFIAALVILWRAIMANKPYAKIMAVGIAPFCIASPIEFISYTAANDIPDACLWSLVFFICVEGLIVGHRFAANYQLATRLSNNLEGEVALQTAELSSQNLQLSQAHDDLRNANLSLQKLSITDGLTQIHNRMYFEQEYKEGWQRSLSQRTPLSVLMIDVDHFKQLNDSAGHQAGDKCLQAIGQLLKQHFKRSGERVARYGGEEFIAMLPNTDQRRALAIAEGLRVAISQLTLRHGERSFKVTVSIGIATSYPSPSQYPDELLAAADEALYSAKRSGRNRVELSPLTAPDSGERRQQQQLV